VIRVDVVVFAHGFVTFASFVSLRD